MPDKIYILTVDDDAKIRELLSETLGSAGFDVHAVASLFQARGALAKRRPDLLILDRGLSDGEGLDFLGEIRAQEPFRTLPVLCLTARGSSHDKIEGLRKGSDDYLTKPFTVGELVARVEAILRRARMPPEPAHFFALAGLTLSLDSGMVAIGKTKISLTPKEFELLAVLLEHQGKVLSRHFLLERVWGSGLSLRLNPKTVDVSIGRLRRALGEWGRRIEPVESQGYRIS